MDADRRHETDAPDGAASPPPPNEGTDNTHRDTIAAARVEARQSPSSGASPTRRRGIGVRLGVGVAVLALGAAATWAVAAVPSRALEAAPPSLTLSPVPVDQQRICPGPLALLGQSSADPSKIGFKGYAELAVAGTGTGATPTLTGITPAVTSQASPAAPTANATGVPALLAAGAGGGEASTLAASQSVAVQGPGAAGFAVTNCRTPAADLWLAGGATTTGTSTVLTIVNPTGSTATIRAALFGGEGALPAARLDGLQVPARSQVAVPLEGIAPGNAQLAVHLTSRGASITAALHVVELNGITPFGVDVVGSVVAPSTRLDLVGVPFSVAANEEDESLFANRGPVLRLVSAGTEPGEATVRIRGLDGTELEPIVVPLEPGVVADVPLSSTPIGRYSVAVTSTEPVVGALHSTTIAGQTDDAWALPSPSLSGTVMLPVAPGPGIRLNLANLGAAPVAVRLVGPDGTVVHLDIAPGVTVQQPLGAAGAYRLEGLDHVAGTVTYDGTGQMASVPVLSSNPLGTDLTVYR